VKTEADMTLSSKTRQDLITGIVIYVSVAGFLHNTFSMPPDSALYPRMILLLFAVLNTAMVIASFKKSGEGPVSIHLIKLPLVYFGGVAVYALLFKFLGYFPATAIELIVFFLMFKVRPWWKIPFITALYLLFIYVLFVFWLKIAII
jgi:hypothetical protein